MCEQCATLLQERKPSTHDSYKYGALSRPEDTTRFLAWPADPDKSPYLVEGPILDNASYEAVSHAWTSDGTSQCPLEVDGNTCIVSNELRVLPLEDQKLTLHVSAAVASLLRPLRPVTGWSLLWVDAICINQSDPLERHSRYLCWIKSTRRHDTSSSGVRCAAFVL
jgi:hypothetical protein